MGTKVECKSYLPGFHSMRDLNEDSNSCSWPLFYGDRTYQNGQYYNGFLPGVVADAYPGYDKDVVKRTMLEHETIFRNQVYELHRLYRTQKDLMDEIKRKELHKNWIPIETSLSSSPLASQVTSEGARKWHMHSFPLGNSVCARPSVSGAEDNHSSFSSIKGNTVQAVSFPYQNGCSSKDIEMLESRPTKFRRKMLDLQLPADEYIDTEEVEPSREEKECGLSSYLTNGNSTNASEKSTKLFHGDADKTGSQEDALRVDECVRTVNGLADLNEPILVEETNSSTCVDLLGRPSCHDETRGQELSGKPRPHFVGLPKEISLNSNHGSNDERLNSLQLESHGNGSRWFSHVPEVGHGKNNLISVSQSLQPEKLSVSSQPIQDRSSKEHEPPLSQQGYQRKVNHPWWERTNGGFEISNYNHPESAVVPRMPSLYTVAPSSDLAKPWSFSVSCCEKPNSSLSQKSISDQMHQYLNSSATLSKSSQSSTQGHVNFSDRWQGFGSEFPNRNGFYQGSSSGSKLSSPLPSISYDNVVYEHFMNQGSTNHKKSSICLDVNLNVAPSNSVSSEAAPQQCLGVIDRERKHGDHHAVLPWLRPYHACNEATNVGNESNLKDSIVFQSSPHQSSNKSETKKGVITNHLFPQNIKSISWPDNADAKRIRSDCTNDKKILGFSIFEKHHISNNRSSLSLPAVSLHHPSGGGVVETNRKIRTLDINLPCGLGVPELSKQIDAEVQVQEKQTEIKSANFRHDIDLNSCICEDEDSSISSVPITNAKVMTGIDLEAPLTPEPEEDAIPLKALENQYGAPLLQQIPEELQKELEAVAAEAIVAISSSVHTGHLSDTSFSQLEASAPGPLHWFAEVVSSCGDDLDSKFEPALIDVDVSSSEEVDYFESMTLKLTETSAEEYIPDPFVPETVLLEESGSTPAPNRPRRGQARRGRQRRDFQRDILPGLTSLSRHEVTEDLQTFGGLMRATGHPWHLGQARRNSTRNGSARGRRRSVVNPPPAVATIPTHTPLVQQLNNIEVGWGKTTRRPRRQRCPAGIPPPLPLT